MAGGLLSGLTGNRAWLGVLDDPIKGREAAESQTIRDKTWEAYRDDFCSRLVPGAPQVMILTRWHEDDPAGRILPEDWAGESGVFEGRDGGRGMSFAARRFASATDDPLGRNRRDALARMVLARTLEAVSDRRSLVDEPLSAAAGARRGHVLPAGMVQGMGSEARATYYGTSDYAVTDGGGDYTVHRVWGIDAGGNIYRVDGWRGQATSDVWIEQKLNLIAKHKPLAWFGEGGVIQKAIEPMLRRRMIERKIFCRLEWLPSVADKPTRARSFQAMAAIGPGAFRGRGRPGRVPELPGGQAR
jgi:hypothetical protein